MAGIGIPGIKPYFLKYEPALGGCSATLRDLARCMTGNPDTWTDFRMDAIPGTDLANHAITADGFGLSGGDMIAVPEWWPDPTDAGILSTIWADSAGQTSLYKLTPCPSGKAQNWQGYCETFANLALRKPGVSSAGAGAASSSSTSTWPFVVAGLGLACAAIAVAVWPRHRTPIHAVSNPAGEDLRRVGNRWALVSRSTGRPLAYYRGRGKPPQSWVSQQERRVHYFSGR